ncbi:7522_t:CDS:1 [Ambispora leptoticha]|uniref:7522_t:CDS:1 n=1 Tax=Ambispora leptoticha TaxID=144679 RepID=A0A9N8ZSG4_9GLOM|nr:7522_t:CDS:1 [Ambispora leptoticha]
MFAKVSLFLNFAILLLESSNVLSAPIIITPTTHFEKRGITPFFSGITPFFSGIVPFGPAANSLENINFADNNFAASTSPGFINGFFGPTSVADSTKHAHVAALDNAFIKRTHIAPVFGQFGPEAEKLDKIFFADNVFAASSSNPSLFGTTSVADSAKKAHVAAFDNAFIKRTHVTPFEFFGPEAEKIEQINFADHNFAASSAPGFFGPTTSVADSAKEALVFTFDNAMNKRAPVIPFFPEAEKIEKILFADDVFAASSSTPGFFGPTSIADSSKKAHVAAFDNAFIKRDPSVVHPLQFLGPDAEKLEQIIFVDNNFAASNSHGFFGPTSVADSSKMANVAAFDHAFD